MPTFDPDILPNLTRERFPGLASSELTVEALTPEGSDRFYFRIRPDGEPDPGTPATLLVMKFDSAQRPENRAFVPHTGFLKSLGIAVPEILAEDSERELLWIEDLGDRDLWAARDEPWQTVRQPLYKSVLEEINRLHRVDEAAFANLPNAPRDWLEPAFDEALYAWERDYFFDHFVSNFSALDASAATALRRHDALTELGRELASRPRALVHRDFQSRNILIHEGRPCLIDYQGMRFGLPEYDLASLLLDPYVTIPDDERESLLRRTHAQHAGMPGRDASFDAFLDGFHRCAAQRLMQALGAYGFLGLVKEKRQFLASIPQAVHNLRHVVSRVPALQPLATALELKPSPPTP